MVDSTRWKHVETPRNHLVNSLQCSCSTGATIANVLREKINFVNMSYQIKDIKRNPESRVLAIDSGAFDRGRGLKIRKI